MTEFFLIGGIFLLAGFVQGLSGFGSALVAIPLLILVMDIKEAVPLCTLSGIVITTYLAVKLSKHFDRKKIVPLCIGSIPGIFVGATLLKTVPSRMISILLGILLIAYSLYNLLFSPEARKLNYRWGYLAGFLSGAIGAAFSAGGPPSIIYATLNKWNKDEIKATLTGFFVFNSYLTAASHAVSGITTMLTIKYLLFSAPFVLMGTALGSRCYGLFEKDSYMKIIFLFLIVMGAMMII